MAAGARTAAPLAATLATMTTCGAAARLIDTAAHRTSAAGSGVAIACTLGSAAATTCAAARLIDTAPHRTSAAAAGSGVASPCAVSVVDSSPAVPAIAANAASRAADR